MEKKKSTNKGSASSAGGKKKRNLTPEERKRRIQQLKRRQRVEHVYDTIKGAILTVFGIIIALGIIAIALAGVYLSLQLRDTPELDVSKIKTYSSPSTIYDDNNEYVMTYGDNENVTTVSIGEVPDTLTNAFVAIEDHKFYQHHGIDVKRLIGAILGQLTGKADYGGSTITQQLIKRTLLTSERTYKRKIQEIYLAIELEKILSKDEIMEAYLNNAFMGGTIYGIKNAALNYFGVENLQDLTLRQCACLAGVVQSPNTYSPRIGYENGDLSACNKRTDTVLYTMHNEGMISDAEYEKALKDDLGVVDTPPQTAGTFYTEEYYNNAYFIDYAMTDIATVLCENENPNMKPNNYEIEQKKKLLKNGGYRIYLSLDREMQSFVQNKVEKFTSYPTATKGQEAQVSAVVMDHTTGELKAIIGGRHRQDTIDGFNRATDSTQAVGSTIKPLSVYAPALDLGFYPGSTVLDVQERIPGYDSDEGYPAGATSGGPMTMREALETSHNVAAARFFLEDVSIVKSHDYLVAEGFDDDHLTLTTAGLALGANDVTTLEMTGAYACLANGGVYIRPHTYTKVISPNGEVILSSEYATSKIVFKESTSWLITDMMETNMVNGLGTNAKLNNVKSCGKTGTHEHKVVSFGGYTHWYTSCLRISTDDYGDFTNSSSFYQSSALWKSYMDPIHNGYDKNTPIQNKTAEELGIKKYYVCKNSGLLATNNCTNDGFGYYEYATENSVPTTYCSEHIYVKNDNWWENAPEDAIWDPDGHGWWSVEGEWHGEGYWDENGWHSPGYWDEATQTWVGGW